MEAQAVKGEKWGRANGRAEYPVMTTEDLAALPVKNIAAKDCALLMWATFPKLDECLQVMEKWGWRYVTCAFTWVKTNPLGGVRQIGKDILIERGFKFSLGYYTRANPEICLLGMRGKMSRIDNSIPNLLIAPVGRHSAKPPEIRNRIVQLFGERPRIELFARSPENGDSNDGWDRTGLDLDGVDIREFLARHAP